jgi:RTX calcium-binding nonapeptide repeat (4 copies)/LVIVD repeat
MKWTRKAVIAAALMLFAVVGSATGDSRQPASDSAPWVTDGGPPAAFGGSLTGSTFAPGLQHGPSADHLPAVRENIDVVGKLEMQTPDAFKFDPNTDAQDPTEPNVVEGQIADLAVYKNAAYLASWSEPSCRRGGFFSVDISNPAAPRQLAFVPALPETYHGEGMHARTISTPAFSGDVLAVNNEPCPGSTIGVGGFDLYDVSNPANPQALVMGAGDRSPDDTSEAQNPAQRSANSSHSIFIWQDGPRAFAVIVDNTELHDVDIFDITNPRAPVFVGDHDLVEIAEAQGVDIIDNSANGDEIFHHDMIVKEINGIQTMLVSYWDAGYIKLNVEDPANPVIIGDSAFDEEDPLVADPRTGRGWNPPEGNGHQAEFSHDNRFVLAADEDFSTYRLPRFDITNGPHAGEYPAGEFGFTTPLVRTLPDNNLNGPTFFGGYGCDADNRIPPAPGPGVTLDEGEEAILVVSRGPQSATADPSAPYPACTFQEKAENAAAAGWDAVIIGNHHSGAGGGAQPDSHLCGSGDFADIIAICIGHRAMHFLFDNPPGQARGESYAVPYDNTPPDPQEPQVGDRGWEVQTSAEFDGWGYTHLYSNAGNDLQAVDHFAIEEAIDERYVFGFGDLSVHEFATDPTEYLAYSSYYAGGMRVLRFGDSGLEQTGKFIDEGGSNFWGVEVFTTPQGDRLFAGSDRDFGLYIFRYTGPGAAQKPACSDVTVMVPYRQSARVPFACSDANNNPLRQSRTSNPEGGTVADHPPAGGWTYTHTGRRLGPAGSFGFRANDGAADSNVATASLVAVARRGRCVNPFDGTNRRDVIVGSRFGDRVRGRRAGDSLRGRAGRDCLFGNAGRDRVSGQGHGDRVFGNRGRDRVAGNAGRDRLFGNQGNDRLLGGGGRDRLRGGSGRNRYSAGAGADRVFARNGKVDRVRCGKGRDRVVADPNDRVAGDCERVRRG